MCSAHILRHTTAQRSDSQSRALVLSSIGLGALGSDWTGVEVEPHRMAAAVGKAFLPATADLDAVFKARAERKDAMVNRLLCHWWDKQVMGYWTIEDVYSCVKK